MKYLAVFIVFLVIFLHYNYSTTLYTASGTLPRTPTNITFSTNQWACNRGGVESCAISTTYSLYLFIQFLSQILALTDNKISHQPTCPKPDPRVATRPLPRPLYFWYLLVQFETYIVVTVYCPCESIKHQVVEKCFQSKSRQSCPNVRRREHQNRFGAQGNDRGCVKRFVTVQESELQAGAHDQSVCCEASALLSSWDVESRQCQNIDGCPVFLKFILVLPFSGNKSEVFRPPLMDWCEIGIGFWILGERWDQ